MINKFFGLMLLSLVVNVKTINAQDWANLSKYKNQNTEVKDPASGEKRVIYMGDSITDFWINYDSVFFASNAFLDRGISGQTTGQMLLRFRQDVISLKPKIVVILAGINDIAENNGPAKLEDIFGNIVSMVQLAKASHIKVVLSSLLPASSLSWRPQINPVQKVRELNSMIKDYADKNDIIYLDYFNAMVDDKNGLKKELGKDDVHPNLAGYKVMELLAKKAIVKALGK